jgi:hypothetical protein
MKIKKGKKYECVSLTHPANEHGLSGYVLGDCYPSKKNNYLIDGDGDSRYTASYSVCFKKVTSKKSLENRVDALEKQVRHVRNLNVANSIIETTKNICDSFKVPPKPDTIYVPDGILDGDGDILNGKHCLHYVRNDWRATSSIESWTPSTPNQFKLVPCKREDLKAGDVAFRSDNPNMKPIMVRQYCIIVEEGYQYWDGKNCSLGSAPYANWYKIVEA